METLHSLIRPAQSPALSFDVATAVIAMETGDVAAVAGRDDLRPLMQPR